MVKENPNFLKKSRYEIVYQEEKDERERKEIEELRRRPLSLFERYLTSYKL